MVYDGFQSRQEKKVTGSEKPFRVANRGLVPAYFMCLMLKPSAGISLIRYRDMRLSHCNVSMVHQYCSKRAPFETGSDARDQQLSFATLADRKVFGSSTFLPTTEVAIA